MIRGGNASPQAIAARLRQNQTAGVVRPRVILFLVWAVIAVSIITLAVRVTDDGLTQVVTQPGQPPKVVPIPHPTVAPITYSAAPFLDTGSSYASP